MQDIVILIVCIIIIIIIMYELPGICEWKRMYNITCTCVCACWPRPSVCARHLASVNGKGWRTMMFIISWMIVNFAQVFFVNKLHI